MFAFFDYFCYNDGVTGRWLHSCVLGVFFVIRNLNQFSFKDYGTVAPERTPDESAICPAKQPNQLFDWELQAVCRATSEVWVRFGEGMTVLSVSLDGNTYLSYYLDKLVCIKPGVYFYLAPFRDGNAGAQIWSETEPEVLGVRDERGEYTLENNLHVTEVCTFFYHEKERGFFYAGESHSVLELAYVDQGTMHSVADGMDLFLEQGEMVVYAPDQWHMQYADMDAAPRYVTVSFEITGGSLQPLFNRKLRLSQSAVTLLQQMLREQERMEPYADDMIAAQLTQLLLTTLRQQDLPTQKIKASNSLNSENEIIRRAQQYICAHIREKLTVPHVARMVDVSPSYMTALFHKNLQLSPGEYIRRIKMQESKQMIREGNMNFTEIAAALHYSTVHHFSRQFKEKFGITPTEYAKSVR